MPRHLLPHHGRVIFSLRELEKGETWYTENRNCVRRISDTHVLLGETIELAIPEEEDFDVSRGILTFNGEQPLLLLLLPVRVRSVADPFFVAFVIHIIIVIVITIVQEDTQVSAEAEVERLSGMKFYEGIPLSSVEVEGAQERGIVVFTLQQLPDGQPFYFDHKSRLTIARMGDNLYAINGKEFQGAVVKQVLPSDSSLLDLVFPHGGRKEADLADDDGDEGDEDEGGDGSGSHEAIMQQILAAAAASEEAQADEEEEIARAMLREFDERLKGATLRRAQEKRRRLSLMMKQYSTDPSSPFRALFLPSSPLSTSGTTIPVRLQPQDRNDIDDQQQQKSSPEATHCNDDDDDVHASETAGGLVIPSGRADHGETRPDAGLGGKCQQEPPRQDLLVAREEERDDDNDEEGLLLEDVDLNTPRHERRAAAAAPHDDGGDGGALAEHHQQEEQAPVAAHAPTQVEQDGNTAAAGHEDDELEQQEPGDHH
ncbi:uncharacterized protein ACA1_174050 [Acanthamoeba castellanii str. Neff]|uniref:Uncharacterized protein n=1 Tax=Acanthamoeba castellanii (strain ATCC 30010 / Neff) TaxID=1257118 RepID=L8HHQ9_ACACF|nr:uncharacterized protein ACA1_174050 [Acanthamoeba castellanii str. Neff]ELR24747.1 hypothetical protein ACA1_174050 [Acanthamoeba castellanii str. Neff]